MDQYGVTLKNINWEKEQVAEEYILRDLIYINFVNKQNLSFYLSIYLSSICSKIYIHRSDKHQI